MGKEEFEKVDFAKLLKTGKENLVLISKTKNALLKKLEKVFLILGEKNECLKSFRSRELENFVLKKDLLKKLKNVKRKCWNSSEVGVPNSDTTELIFEKDK